MGLVLRGTVRGMCLGLLFLAAACSSPTPYIPAPGAAGGYGYRDGPMGDGVFYVRFDGNAETTPRDAEDFALLRAADLTVSLGHTYFVVGDWLDGTETVTTHHPGATFHSTGQSGQAATSPGHTSTAIYPSYRMQIRPVDAESIEDHLFWVHAPTVAAGLRSEHDLAPPVPPSGVGTDGCPLGSQP